MFDKHIFFDLDRTLWDFDRNSEQALLELYNAHAVSFNDISFDQFHRHYKRVNQDLWHRYTIGKMDKESLRSERFRKTFQRFGLCNEELVTLFGDGYVTLSPKKTNLIPHTHEVLDELVGHGFSLHVITNGFSEIQEIKLENCGIRSYFKEVICSEAIGVNKPNPRIFKHALECAKASATDALMVGDDYRTDIIGAIRSGMQAVWYNPSPEPQKSKVENQINCLRELPWLALKLLRS